MKYSVNSKNPAFIILPFWQNTFSEAYNLTHLLHIEVFLYVFYLQNKPYCILLRISVDPIYTTFNNQVEWY